MCNIYVVSSNTQNHEEKCMQMKHENVNGNFNSNVLKVEPWALAHKGYHRTLKVQKRPLVPASYRMKKRIITLSSFDYGLLGEFSGNMRMLHFLDRSRLIFYFSSGLVFCWFRMCFYQISKFHV